MQKLPVLFSLCLVVSACSNPPTGGPQGACDSCDSGFVCIENNCEKICQTLSDCPGGQVCLAIGYCDEPSEGTLPQITAVRGNQESDGTKIQDGLLVDGLALTDAIFELQSATLASQALTIRSQTDTFAEIVFPADILSGEYVLVATNSAGSAQAPVTLTLPELDGNEILTRLNSADTSGTLAVSRLPVGSGAGEVAAGNHGHADLASTAELLASEQALQERIVSGRWIPNGDFRKGLAGWSIQAASAGDIDVADVLGDGPNGDYALVNTPNVAGPTWVSSDTWLPVDRREKYILKAAVKVESGNYGAFFLAVRLRDAAGNEITGDGEWWYYAGNNIVLGDNDWHHFYISFGGGTGPAFPPEADSMTLGLILNADPADIGVGGNRTFHVQGLELERSNGPRIYRSQVSTGTVASGDWLPDSPTFFAAAGEPVTIQVSYSGRPNAHGHTYGKLFWGGVLLTSMGVEDNLTWRRTMTGQVNTAAPSTGEHAIRFQFECGSGTASFTDGASEWPLGGLSWTVIVGE